MASRLFGVAKTSEANRVRGGGPHRTPASEETPSERANSAERTVGKTRGPRDISSWTSSAEVSQARCDFGALSKLERLDEQFPRSSEPAETRVGLLLGLLFLPRCSENRQEGARDERAGIRRENASSPHFRFAPAHEHRPNPDRPPIAYSASATSLIRQKCSPGPSQNQNRVS